MSFIPRPFDGWLPDLLGGPIPPETNTTCATCAMLCPSGGQDAPNYFRPETKCCTFHPEHVNYLVGAVLEGMKPGEDPGYDLMFERVSLAHGLSPLGVHPPAPYKILYPYWGPAFGRTPLTVCPFYLPEIGSCSLWRFRSAVCCTYHCKYVRGLVGHTFWNRLLRLISQVERELSCHCATRLLSDPDAIIDFIDDTGPQPPAMDEYRLAGQVNPQAEARYWGPWKDRKHDFYLKCWEIVRDMSWPQVMAVTGPLVEIMARSAKVAYDNLMSETLPARLRHGSYTVQNRNETHTVLVSYWVGDPIMLENRTLECLVGFQGQDLEAARAAILERYAVQLTDPVIRRLLDFQLLVAVP